MSDRCHDRICSSLRKAEKRAKCRETLALSIRQLTVSEHHMRSSLEEACMLRLGDLLALRTDEAIKISGVRLHVTQCRLDDVGNIGLGNTKVTDRELERSYLGGIDVTIEEAQCEAHSGE